MAVRFERPSVSRVRQIIRHPAYAGAYIYGMKHWRRVQRGGVPVPEHRLIGQYVAVWDHHDPYISRDEYLENQHILTLNAHGPNQSQLGPGPSLLQGRCRCARHGAMVVHYQPRVRRKTWSFCCQGEYLRGGIACVIVPGLVLENYVTSAVLAALDVPVVEEAQRLWRAAHREWGQRHRRLELELSRKREQLDRVKQRLLEPDGGSRIRVRAMLEEEFEKVAAEIEALRLRLVQQDTDSDPFTEARWEELKRLCASVPRIWQAATTTNQDRKQIVRLLVSAVVIEKVEPERIVARIEWTDERPATPIEIFRTPYFHRLIWDWHLEGRTPAQMVDKLAAIGARTLQGNPWSLETVQKTLALMVKQSGPSRPGIRRRLGT